MKDLISYIINVLCGNTFLNVEGQILHMNLKYVIFIENYKFHIIIKVSYNHFQ